jgi:CheY-like chemotaxis protein
VTVHSKLIQGDLSPTPFKQSTPATAEAGAPRRVLIIEDEPLIALGLRMVLEGMGLVVQAVAATATAAIDSARRLDIDLVLADVRLKHGDDGITAVKEILRFQDVPVLFVTGNGMEVAERGLGHLPVLNKPFQPAALERQVSILLRLE